METVEILRRPVSGPPSPRVAALAGGALWGKVVWNLEVAARRSTTHTAQNDGPRRGERDGCPRGGDDADQGPRRRDSAADASRSERGADGCHTADQNRCGKGAADAAGPCQGPAGAAAPHALERAHDERGRPAPVRAPRRQGRRRGPVAPGRVQALPQGAPAHEAARARGRAGATGRGAPGKGPDRRQRAAPPEVHRAREALHRHALRRALPQAR